MIKVSIFIYLIFSYSNLYGFLNLNSNAILNESENKIIEVIRIDLKKILPQMVITAVEKSKVSFSINERSMPLDHQVAAFQFSYFKHPEININFTELKKLSQIPYLSVFSNDDQLADQNPKRQKYNAYYKHFLAKIIHEIGHFYDHTTKNSPAIIKEKQNCINERKGPKHNPSNGYQSNNCRRYLYMNTAVSSNPLFLNAAGYTEKGLIDEVNSYSRSNYLTLRSISKHEWENPKESFAFNFELFLLDPEFQCRRPTLYEALAIIFKERPFKRYSCQSNNTIFLSSTVQEKLLSPFIKIDFSKVYAIHYLFAGKGNESFSKFGHSMLRLIICKPSRKVVNEDCLKDINHHLVISFRALVTDLKMISLNGINGLYPSIEFVFYMSSIIREYTKGELRGIKSLPLKLSRNEIETLLKAIIESQWTYEGKYKFFTNNCADETLQVLKRGLPLNKAIQELSISRPDSLYKELIKTGIGEEKYLFDEKEAVQKGYYFPSMQQNYEDAINILKKNEIIPRKMTVENYFLLPASERQKLIHDALDNKIHFNANVINSLFLLENKVLDNNEQLRFSKAILNLDKRGNESGVGHEPSYEVKFDNKVSITSKELIEMLQNSIILTQSPGYLIKLFNIDEGGYGLPSSKDMDTLMKKFNNSEKLKSLQEERIIINQSINYYLDGKFKEDYAITKQDHNLLRKSFKQHLSIDLKIPLY